MRQSDKKKTFMALLANKTACIVVVLFGAVLTIAADHLWGHQGLSTLGLIIMLGGFALYIALRWFERGR